MSASVAVGPLQAVCASRNPSRRVLAFDRMRSILRFAVITPHTPIRIFRNHRLIAHVRHLRRMPSMQLHRQHCRDVWVFQPTEPT